jgi:hypothetical protein
MTTPIVLSALAGASVSFLATVLFNSLRDSKSDRRGTTEYRARKEEVWE